MNCLYENLHHTNHILNLPNKLLINALILFIKNPEKGKVKTRLAKTVGDDRALAIYKALLEHTRTLTLPVDATRFLFYSNQINHEDDWSPDNFQKEVQNNGDLGDRMKAAFAKAFEQHDQVLIIGSDCASLTTEIVKEGFEKLANHDFVFGPAMDGGYYLLGMNEYTPALFEEMPWSTESVAKITLDRIKAMGKSCFLLKELSDIDFEEDWEKWGWEI